MRVTFALFLIFTILFAFVAAEKGCDWKGKQDQVRGTTCKGDDQCIEFCRGKQRRYWVREQSSCTCWCKNGNNLEKLNVNNKACGVI